MKAGWQQPASQPACVHFGLLAAGLTINSHSVGHEWVCTCGAVFVVRKSSDGTKCFRRTRGRRND